MKIALISPYTNIKAYSIRTLSSSLKQHGHEVKLMFLPSLFAKSYDVETLNQTVELTKHADLIGISVMTNFFDNVVQLTNTLKDSARIPILWGGIHPTIRPEESLNYANMICIGEAEETIVELAEKMDNNHDYHDVIGMWFKHSGGVKKNPIRPLIKNLDSIALPDYDYKSHYILSDGMIRKMTLDLMEQHMGSIYMTLPTRGCPFSCAYCCNSFFNQLYPSHRLLRKRSNQNVIKELVKAKQTLPFIRMIKFDDDGFFVKSLEDIKSFCESYKKHVNMPLDITGAAPSTLTHEKLVSLIDAGLVNVRMGIQSGSASVKNLYQRRDSNEKVEAAVRLIHEFIGKIQMPQYDIILDNPWEKDENLIETLMFLVKLPTPYKLSLFSLNLYPGTELYDKAKQDNLINDDLNDIYRKHYHECSPHYLNKLFFLLNDYATNNLQISHRMMAILTNSLLRALHLNWALYYLLLGRIKLKITTKTFIKSLQNGGWYRGPINFFRKELNAIKRGFE